MVADIDQALADLAAQAKRQVGADLGGDHAGQGDGRREVDDFRGHGLDPRQRHYGGAVVLASRQKAEADQPDRERGIPKPPFARCYQVRHHRAMPTIKRLSFIGLEYAFAPAKAYGMSRGGGFRRQGGLVEVETDAGVRGIGEAFGNPLVTLEYFRMVEPMFIGKSVFDFDHVEARIRNAMYHLGVGNQLTACLAAHQRGALRRHRPRLRRARLRPDRRLRHDAHPGLRLDRLLLRRSRAPARPHAGRGGCAIPMPAPRSRSAAASGTTSSACARRARRWGRTSS